MPTMKMKIIALRGEINSGKTRTLNKLIKKIIPLSSNLHRCPTDTDYDNEKVDRWVVLEYEGRTIAIITAGDGEKVLEKNFNEIQDYNKQIDLYICPTHSREGTIHYVENMFGKKFVLWVRKLDIWRPVEDLEDSRVDLLQNEYNERQAFDLLNIINIFC